ncbi:hypothetical protein O6H91_20G001100 [Diphasiastrum complanatum]|uniref:Uncharacterized protein n=1 Tax=Diphasiastrum complanatum TaxID=34168 RepID=A0ACC2AMH1_DIPCM|nr:hypothetical protein O6H91_Y339900 [Diphasiastrum complanatum]KAJ7518630.1 hypothetical protein O6H91_20G001100 [Diphasiastrum complanatum]
MASTHDQLEAGGWAGAAWWVIVFTALTVLFIKYVICIILEAIWWKPMRIVRKMQSQGIKARPYQLLGGDFPEMMKLVKAAQSETMTTISHDIVPRILPCLGPWCASLGTSHVFWQGTAAPTLTVMDPEMVKDIMSTKSSCFHRASLEKKVLLEFIGKNILTIEDDEWTHHRRIINSTFNIEKLKGMLGAMVTSTDKMIKRWATVDQLQEDSCFEVEVCEEFYKLAMDIFSRTSFGNAHKQSKKFGRFQVELKKLVMSPSHLVWTIVIPGYRILPTPNNRHINRIKRNMNRILDEIIRVRLQRAESGKLRDYGNDLLGCLLYESEAGDHETKGRKKLSINDVIHECHALLFAGHDSTANLLTWTIMLLSLHPQWQERARKEVLEICNGKPIDDEKLRGFKILTMILQEVLRLYPAVADLTRVAVKNTTIQGWSIPEGLQVWVPILQIHRDPEQWGADALEFRPDRFAGGVSKACKNSHSYIPFSCGQRTCVGQTFAMMEAKVALSMILQRFSFQLSSKYKHGPTTKGALHPEFGMPVIFHKLTSFENKD